MCRIFRILVPTLVVVAMPFAPHVNAQESPPAAESGVVSDVPGALNGAEAFVSLLLTGELAEVAAGVDWTVGELANTLLTDDSLFVTDALDLGYADTAPGPGEFTNVEPSPGSATASSVFTLHSQPAAPLTIFLDFDGHTTKNTGWNEDDDAIVSTPLIAMGIRAR